MFSIEQIKAAHSKVKTGADFPNYVQDIKDLGVLSDEHYVSDGHIKYYGNNDFTISADAKWAPVTLAEQGATGALKKALSIHQQGKTGYVDFCRQAADAGV